MAKELKSVTMMRLLNSGKRNIRRNKVKPPYEGTFWPLFCKQLKNGWYYQVDYVHDNRMCNKPYVIVWGFKPPKVMWAKSAEYFLYQEL